MEPATAPTAAWRMARPRHRGYHPRIREEGLDDQPAMLGRNAERERLERFVASARPRVLLIEGESGIGKTTLWWFGVAAAARAGSRVLAFRAGETERSLTFAGLTGLLPDAVIDEVLPHLPEPRRRALETALLRSDETPVPADPRTVGLALVSALVALAERGPLLLAVDDLQWLDEPTERVLAFALRRIGEANVGVLAARRTDAAHATSSMLEAAVPEGRCERVVVGALSAGALGRLLRDRLALSLPRLVSTRLHQESRGNPFVALELARAAQVRGSLPAPGEPFPVPADVLALVGDRIARLSPDANDALLAISLAARPTAELVAAAIGEAVAEEAIGELLRGELVRVDEHERLSPSHPLVASVARAGAPAPRRRLLHRRLAALIDDVEERARHLALGAEGPDEATAHALDAAAELARRRGAPEAAAELAEMAASATPAADVRALARRELAVARHRLQAGSLVEAKEAALHAVRLLPEGPGRVDPLLLVAKIDVQLGDVASARGLFDQALTEAGDDRDGLLRAHIEAGHWADDVGDADGTREAEHARAALELLAGREDEDPGSAARALLMLVEARFRGGGGLDLELLDRAVDLEQGASLPMMDRPSTQGAIGLGLAGRHAESIDAIQACLERAEREGEWGYRPTLLRSLAWTHWCMGDLEETTQEIERTLELSEELGVEDGISLAMSGQFLAARGFLEEARPRLERALARSREVGYWWWELRSLAGMVFLALTEGDAGAAAAVAAETAALGERTGTYEPGWNRVHGDVIEALLAGGRRDEADRLTCWLEERAASSGHPWSLTVSARCRGLLAAAEGRSQEALERFERSLAEAADMRFERARTLLAKGECLRRANRRRAARDTLEEARRLFERCGSPPWAGRATAELGAVSGRVPRPTELTEMERRVAELAAEGRTNQEIAARLFVSIRTVESHLSSVYRKLGIRRRAELAARPHVPTGQLR